MSIDRESLEAEIERAFSNEGQNPGLFTSSHPTHPDSVAISQELAGKTWQEIDRQFWIVNYFFVVLLTPATLVYFLPSILLATLQDTSSDQGLLHAVLRHLAPKDTLERKALSRGYRSLSRAAKNAIRSYLTFLGEAAMYEAHRHRATKVLASFWLGLY